MTFCRLRWLSTEASQPSDGEKNIQKVLQTKFPAATDIKVQDISGQYRMDGQTSRCLGSYC